MCGLIYSMTPYPVSVYAPQRPSSTRSSLSTTMSESSLDVLLSMGFSELQSRQALQEHPHSLENAIQSLVEGLEGGSSTDKVYEEDNSDLKMVCVIRADLNMSAGKVASQCVHAALGAIRHAQQLFPGSRRSRMLLSAWEETGEKVVSLRCSSKAELDALHATAIQAGSMPLYMVHDAGRTEVETGAATVLAIGPASTARIDSITGRLKLY